MIVRSINSCKIRNVLLILIIVYLWILNIHTLSHNHAQHARFTRQNCYGKTFVEGRIGDVDKVCFFTALPAPVACIACVDKEYEWRVYKLMHTCARACARTQSHFYSYDLKRKYQYMEEKVKGAQDANIGFFEEFGIDPDSPLEEARGHLRRLQQDMWINQGTAWLQTDFVTYNPNVGLFCFVKFTFEMLNTGEIRTHFQADTMKGRLYQTAGDIMVLIFELISIFFWLIFVIRMWRLILLQWRATKSVMTFFEDFDHQLEFVQVPNTKRHCERELRTEAGSGRSIDVRLPCHMFFFLLLMTYILT